MNDNNAKKLVEKLLNEEASEDHAYNEVEARKSFKRLMCKGQQLMRDAQDCILAEDPLFEKAELLIKSIDRLFSGN